MTYSISDINEALEKDEAGFIERCDRDYAEKIAHAADAVAENMKRSRIVLLAGPSGSGKTTTAIKLGEELSKRGLSAKSISMDYYFKNMDENYPRTADGDYDFESPNCVDTDTLFDHFDKIGRGEPIRIPRYDFENGVRSDVYEDYTVSKNEVVIFEGLHALNDYISGRDENALKLYVGVGSTVEGDGGDMTPDLIRLVRRTVRDSKFRGVEAGYTLYLWKNVMDGERKNIAPYRHLADIEIDTFIPYELSVLKSTVVPLYEDIFEEATFGYERFAVLKALKDSCDTEEAAVPGNSLVREFIGDSVYSY